MRFGWIILLAFLSLNNSFADEFRGIWVDAFGPGFLNKDQVTRLVSDCRKYNFNAVFVQMRRRGDAFYFPQAPNPDPRTEVLDPNFDALAEIIQQCHTGEKRIEVHCWLTGYFIWAFDKPPRQPDHLFNLHPEYLTKDSIGQKIVGLGYYLDPGHPDAMMALFNVARDIVSRYNIDGLHWDYLRYPTQDSGYNETAIKRYKNEFGITQNPQPSDPQFCEWRRRQVTDFVRWSTADLLEIRPKLVISASVFSNYKDSRDYRFQDWVAWNREGIVDLVVPMDFSPDNDFVFNPRADYAMTNQGIRRIYIGQGAYMNQKENTLTQLIHCRKNGFAGTVLYSYRKPILEEKNVNQRLPKNEASEIIVDNNDAEAIGAWKTGKFGKFYDDNYLFAEKGTGSNYVRFLSKLPLKGIYSVYEWHVAGENRSAETTIYIAHENGANTVKINQQRNGSRWNLLGHFPFDKFAEVRVLDSAEKNGRVVIADAIRFVFDYTSIDTEPGSKSKEKDSKVIDPEEDRRRLNQKIVFTFLKENYQPAWESTPELPWKKMPATGIIKGTVIDKITGKPVYNAIVSLNSDRRQKTEPHGKFAFFEVPTGKYAVVADDGIFQTNQIVEIKAGQIFSTTLKLN